MEVITEQGAKDHGVVRRLFAYMEKLTVARRIDFILNG